MSCTREIKLQNLLDMGVWFIKTDKGWLSKTFVRYVEQFQTLFEEEIISIDENFEWCWTNMDFKIRLAVERCCRTCNITAKSFGIEE